MKDKITKILNIFMIVYILINPLLDVISGINNNFDINIPINNIFRLLFLIGSIIYLCFLCNTKYKKKNRIYMLVLLIYAILFSLFMDKTYLMLSVKKSLSTFFLPVSILAIFNMYDEYKIKLDNKYIVYSLLIYLLLLSVPNLLGISFKSYKTDGVGHLGFFNSANSISAILSIILPYAIIYFKDNKYKLAIFSIIYLYTILSIGTKTLLLTLLILIIINVIYFLVLLFKKKDYKKISIIVLSVICISLIGLLLLPKTNVYENIRRRIDFFGTNGSVIEVVDNIILGGRIKYLKDVNKYYLDSNITNKLFGIGYPSIVKNVEMDYFDIFYSHGIVGFIIYFIPIIYILKTKVFRRENITFICINKYVSLLIIILLSLITGHVLVEPNVSIYISTIINNHNKKILK